MTYPSFSVHSTLLGFSCVSYSSLGSYTAEPHCGPLAVRYIAIDDHAWECRLVQPVSVVDLQIRAPSKAL